MRAPLPRPTRRAVRLRALGVVAGGVGVAVALSGCEAASTGFLPTGRNGQPITTETGNITNLWVGTWIAALCVGALVWGLTIWCMIAYRRKKDETGLPVQLRYNVPIEMLYTIIPVFMVGTLFYATARDEDRIMSVTNKPDQIINVVGKQWSWDFNYVNANVYESGEHTMLDGKEGARDRMPVLYLPVGKRTEFVLTARDVIHSFWVPDFLQKLDMIPSRVNRFQITPLQEGEYQGKCAELCGAYHSEMLFMVKVVSQQEFDKQMSALKSKGQTGLLNNTLSREELMAPDKNTIEKVTGGEQ